MTTSAPADLAVAFRSFPRRLTDAVATAEDDEHRAATEPFTRQLEHTVAEAARLLGVPTTGDLASDCAAAADEIDRRPSDSWDDATLEQLQALALRAGQLLRQVEAAATA